MKEINKIREEADKINLTKLTPVTLIGQPARTFGAEREAKEYFPKLKFNHFLTDIELSISAFMQSQLHLQLVLKLKEFIPVKDNFVMIQGYAFKFRDKTSVFFSPSARLYIKILRKIKGFAGILVDNQYYQINIYTENEKLCSDIAKVINQGIGGNMIQRVNWPIAAELFNINIESAQAIWSKYISPS